MLRLGGSGSNCCDWPISQLGLIRARRSHIEELQPQETEADASQYLFSRGNGMSCFSANESARSGFDLVGVENYRQIHSMTFPQLLGSRLD
jgi:hypothetical protein